MKKSMISERELPFRLLLIVAVMEFLFITMESLFSYIGYYLVENYILVPCLLFVGIAMIQKLTPYAKKRLLLSVIAVGWFIVVQVIHKLSGMGTHPVGTVFFVYLMAFPFAAVSEDWENRGIDLIGWMLIGAAIVQVFYTVLLILDCVPDMMAQYVYWDGARLHVFWHSNITACFLMVGIGFSFAMLFRIRKRGMRVLLGLMILLQFAAMALTNCRTVLLMTSALFGCIVFFQLWKGGWKRFVIGVVMAAVVMVAAFKLSGVMFEWNSERLKANIVQQLEQTGEQRITEGQFSVNEETSEVTIISNNGQGTLSNDMKTLNGRTWIWQAVLDAIRENRSVALWGTEYVGLLISRHNQFEVVHSHNSWTEALMRLGIPGLLIALVFTGMAVRGAWVLVWSQSVELWKKVVAVMTMCVMVAGFLEPYFFITNVYYHVTDFIFFFCTGYLDLWRRQVKA